MPVITPKAGPAIIQPPTASAKSGAAAEARERAIAKLTQSPPQSNPVPNASKIAPEELSAIQPPKGTNDSFGEAVKAANGASDDIESKQDDTSVSPESDQSAESPKEAKEDEAKDPLSTQYALLARKEKALRAKVQAQDQAIKSREAALQAREEAIKAKEAEYQSDYIPKSKLVSDPFSVLMEAGLSYEQLTQMALNPPAPVDPAVRAQIERLEAQVKAQNERLEKSSKDQVESQQKAYQQAIANLKRDAAKLVESDPESFETIQQTGSIDDVVDLIERTYKEDGYVMSVSDAAKAVEDYLVEEALKISRINKIQKRLAPAQKAEAPKQVEQSNKQSQAPKTTLTNNMGASRPMSAKERAILAFQGKLK